MNGEGIQHPHLTEPSMDKFVQGDTKQVHLENDIIQSAAQIRTHFENEVPVLHVQSINVNRIYPSVTA